MGYGTVDSNCSARTTNWPGTALVVTTYALILILFGVYYYEHNLLVLPSARICCRDAFKYLDDTADKSVCFKASTSPVHTETGTS